MPFCVSWTIADPVEGTAASSQEQEKQLHPRNMRQVDSSAMAALKGSVSSGQFDLNNLFGCNLFSFVNHCLQMWSEPGT